MKSITVSAAVDIGEDLDRDPVDVYIVARFLLADDRRSAEAVYETEFVAQVDVALEEVSG